MADTIKKIQVGDTTYDIHATTVDKHGHDEATTTASGFMSAADKAKLDGIATGATAVTVDSSLSSTSTNPVQNKIVNSALAGKQGTISDLDTIRSNASTGATHAGSTHARTDATKVEASTTNGNIKINGTETTVYTHPTGTNPHGTTKSDVGLGNVGNFKAVSTVANQGLTNTEKSNARANIGAGTSSLTLGTSATTAAKGNHTHGAATSSAGGFMSSTDKKNLDSLVNV